jgi:predicted RNA-binding Zn ribbon-like protein
MAMAIRLLHGDQVRRQRMAENARAAGLIYDRSRAVEAYRDVLEEVLR